MEQIHGKFNWRAARRGQQIPVDEFARIDAAAMRGQEETGGAAGDLFGNPSIASMLTLASIQSIWVKVTAHHTGPVYSAEEVWYDEGNDTYPHDPSSFDLDFSLREVNGRADVAVGTIALAWPSESMDAEDRPLWRFIAPGSGSGGGGTLTIREVDLDPTGPASIVEFDQATGLFVTFPALPGAPARVANTSATPTQMGVVNTGTQSFAGSKTFQNGVTIWSGVGMGAPHLIMVDTATFTSGTIEFASGGTGGVGNPWIYQYEIRAVNGNALMATLWGKSNNAGNPVATELIFSLGSHAAVGNIGMKSDPYVGQTDKMCFFIESQNGLWTTQAGLIFKGGILVGGTYSGSGGGGYSGNI